MEYLILPKMITMTGGIKMNNKIIHGFIDEGGILLDDDYNELRDEEGSATHIPEKDWKHYKIITERWC